MRVAVENWNHNLPPTNREGRWWKVFVENGCSNTNDRTDDACENNYPWTCDVCPIVVERAAQEQDRISRQRDTPIGISVGDW